MGNKVGWRGGVDDRCEASCCEYGDRLRRLWCLCDPGHWCGWWQLGGVHRRPNVGAGGRDCGVWLFFGTTDGMFN